MSPYKDIRADRQRAFFREIVLMERAPIHMLLWPAVWIVHNSLIDNFVLYTNRQLRTSLEIKNA